MFAKVMTLLQINSFRRAKADVRLAGLLLILGCVGCGPANFVPVTGTVLLDGKPVEGAAVVFQQLDGKKDENHLSMAATDAAGNFVLTTDEKPGAFLGNYAVSVRKVRTTGMVADKDGLSGTVNPTAIEEIWDIPQKYGRFETSGFKINVTAGMPAVELKLESPKDLSGEDQ